MLSLSVDIQRFTTARTDTKLVLLAVHFAVHGDIDSLTLLAARHSTVLRKELLLRILLTYLPETLPSSQYVDFLQQLESSSFPDPANNDDVDSSPVADLPDDVAAKKVKKLRLLPLTFPEAPAGIEDDVLTLFLLRRAYKVDEEAGLLGELPALLLPFVDRAPCVRSLLVTTVLPLLRRNVEYYPHDPIPYTVQGFQQLPDRVAVNLLLSQTGTQEAGLPLVGRDLRGLIGPWLSTEKRWRESERDASLESSTTDEGPKAPCPGWDEVLRWITSQASRNWRAALNAFLEWNGPEDADLNEWGSLELNDHQKQHLKKGYAQAGLASAYLIPEASTESLGDSLRVADRVAKLLNLDPASPVTKTGPDTGASARDATYMRNDLLSPSNPLTSPTPASITFLKNLVHSARVLTLSGSPCTVRRSGELALLRDAHEQKAEATKLIHLLRNNSPKTDDNFWIQARKDILWLRDWGLEDGWFADGIPCGIFSQVSRDFLEVEILKALLSNTRYALARNIYEDASDRPLDQTLVQETLYSAAMTAYDNASNPNRTRGGLKKCDEIIKAFPKTIQRSDPQAKRIEALLQATHGLSGYRLVLKQGEPFTPVVLRVHSDPISIIEKILEQNPKSYTHLHDLLTLGTRMVEAGLTAGGHGKTLTPEDEAIHLLTAQRRITAMCIHAALREDDFETAYSYVVNNISSPPPTTATSKKPLPADEHLWKAALQAGKYRRPTGHTPFRGHSQRGSHGGGGLLTSGNPEVRHLEQRIECLAAALRVAPPATLQEIVSAFRRAEEELDVLLREEEERDSEWDDRGDSLRAMPGGFGPVSASASTLGRGGVKVGGSGTAPRRQSHAAAAAGGDDDDTTAPMSLFDLSRASVLSAQRNLSALSGLQKSATLGRLASGGLGGVLGRGGAAASPSGGASDAGSDAGAGGRSSFESGGEGGGEEKRVRKRDQLREAAMGTLVSGVGWLVGAPAPERTRD
ncbi:hypothetical protein VTJ49DRAFT_7052 [Mycothermus thermophilus]|uniref:Sec39 domain-containing protein n=1 Tax=Humicola insolens TaxID=85995 RepID=A0ABR3VHY1_HUMIN